MKIVPVVSVGLDAVDSLVTLHYHYHTIPPILPTSSSTIGRKRKVINFAGA